MPLLLQSLKPNGVLIALPAQAIFLNAEIVELTLVGEKDLGFDQLLPNSLLCVGELAGKFATAESIDPRFKVPNAFQTPFGVSQRLNQSSLTLSGGLRDRRPGDSGLPPISKSNAAANARFFAAAQNDFAARLKWSVTPKFSDANHEPKVKIEGPLEISVRPGNTVHLEGKVSDPDHNAVKVIWWQDNAAGTYGGDILFSDQAALRTTFRVPDDAQPGATIHVILEATDNGTPPLTRYQRLIVRIQ